MKKVISLIFLMASCSSYAMDRRFKLLFNYGDNKKAKFFISGKTLVLSPHLRKLVELMDEDPDLEDKNTLHIFVPIKDIGGNDIVTYIKFLEGSIDLKKISFKRLVRITNLFHFLWGSGDDLYARTRKEEHETVRATPFFFNMMDVEGKWNIWTEFIKSLSEEEALELFPSLAKLKRKANRSVKVDLMAEEIFKTYILGKEAIFLDPKEFKWDFFYERIKDFPASFDQQFLEKRTELFEALSRRIKMADYLEFLEGRGRLWHLIKKVPIDFLNKNIRFFALLPVVFDDLFDWQVSGIDKTRKITQSEFFFEQRVLVKALEFSFKDQIEKVLFSRIDQENKEKILKNPELKRIYFSLHKKIKSELEEKGWIEPLSKAEQLSLADEHNATILNNLKKQIELYGSLLENYEHEFFYIRRLKGKMAKALVKGSRKGFDRVKKYVQEIQELLFKNIEKKFENFITQSQLKQVKRRFVLLEKAGDIIKRLKKLKEDRIADVPELIEKLERLYKNAKLIIEKEGLK